MKKIILFLLFLTVFSINAQVVNPVKWTSKVEKISENEFNLIISGAIEDEWHVYSQFTPDGGPLPMVLEFKNSKGNYELIGSPKESKYKKQYNDVFEVDEYLFEKSVIVIQKIKIINPKTTKINLHLENEVKYDDFLNLSKEELKKVEEFLESLELVNQ
jgi:thiol:disulfide interchange protein DsbD